MNKNTSSKIFNKNNFSNWLIGGFIGFIITEISKPLLGYLYSLFLNFGGDLITSFSNSTYREISNGYAEQTDFSILCIVYYISLVGFMYISSYETNTYQSRNKMISELTMQPDIIDKQNTESNKKIQAHPSSSTYNQLSNKKIRRKLELWNKASFISSLIYIFMYLVFSIFIIGRTTFIIGKITSMTNNIEIVSPYISNQKYKELKSSFHSIETKEDYIQLMDTLSSIASKYSLELK